jgi:hypothetical protein
LKNFTFWVENDVQFLDVKHPNVSFHADVQVFVDESKKRVDFFIAWIIVAYFLYLFQAFFVFDVYKKKLDF